MTVAAADYRDDRALLGTWQENQKEQKKKAVDPLRKQDPWLSSGGSQTGASDKGVLVLWVEEEERGRALAIAWIAER